MPVDAITIFNRTDSPWHDRLQGFCLQILDEEGGVVWSQEDQPTPMFSATYTPGLEPGERLQMDAMDALVAMSPTDETSQWLSPWVRQGPERLRLHAAKAMSELPEDVWVDVDAGMRLKKVRIGTVPHTMRYDTTRIDVLPGQPVEITLINPDDMPHNLLIAKPGSLRRIGRAADAQGETGEALLRDYVPAVSGILHASPLVLPGESATLSFIAPTRPGRYPYICTYPAHWQMMNGVLHVQKEAPKKSP